MKSGEEKGEERRKKRKRKRRRNRRKKEEGHQSFLTQKAVARLSDRRKQRFSPEHWKEWDATEPHVGSFTGGASCPGGIARSLQVIGDGEDGAPMRFMEDLCGRAPYSPRQNRSCKR